MPTAAVANRFPAVAPFDLGRSIAFLRGFTPMAGEHATSASSLTKAFRVDRRPVVARVRQEGDAAAPVLAYELFADGLTPAGERAAAERIRRFLGADEDLAPFYAAAAGDPPMERLTERLRGLHHVTFPSAFESACWGALYQRIPLARARAMKLGIVRAFGAMVVHDGFEHPVFPDATTLAEASEADLAEIVGEGRRPKALAAIARAFTTIDEDWLRAAPLDEARSCLRAIYGVGAFTSGFVLYRALGRFDGAVRFSPRLVEAASRVYGRSITEAAMRRACERYGPWGGHWMLYLWASTFVEGTTERARPSAAWRRSAIAYESK
jgi:DNA-3-methyladenine glycosylase II